MEKDFFVSTSSKHSANENVGKLRWERANTFLNILNIWEDTLLEQMFLFGLCPKQAIHFNNNGKEAIMLAQRSSSILQELKIL